MKQTGGVDIVLTVNEDAKMTKFSVTACLGETISGFSLVTSVMRKLFESIPHFYESGCKVIIFFLKASNSDYHLKQKDIFPEEIYIYSQVYGREVAK
jgi:hypothetical protein